MGIASTSILLSSCTPQRILEGNLNEEFLEIPLSAFIHKEKELNQIIVDHKSLKIPVVVFKTENQYKAFLMKCTHQGVELQLFGEELQCPAHGSSFNSDGEVTNGPAAKNLREFQTQTTEEKLQIILK